MRRVEKITGYVVGNYNTVCFLLEKRGIKVDEVKRSPNNDRSKFYFKGVEVAEYWESRQNLKIYHNE